jgi:hypothetical protein
MEQFYDNVDETISQQPFLEKSIKSPALIQVKY